MPEATGKPRFVILTVEEGLSKGSPYFQIIDSAGNVKKESNVYYMGKREERRRLCQIGAEDDLEKMIKSGRIE